MEFRKQCPASSGPLSLLSLEGLRLPVRIGWSKEEREKHQFVRFEIKIRFQSLPQACETDRLEDTVCYAHLSDLIREICEKETFHLIENLGWKSYRTLKQDLPESAALSIQLHKESPPLPYETSGAKFTLSDWE